MRIAIMGSGAIGSYYGARLAEAGYDVTFIARGEHLKALKAGGLKVVGLEEFHLPQVSATDDPSAVGPVDVVLFCVKTYDTEPAAELARPMVGPATMVVPLQNGVDAVERIGRILGRERVVGGLCRISVEIAAPGTVRIHSPFREIVFGEMDGSSTERTAAFAAALERAGIPYRLSREMRLEIWKKFVFITAFSGITGATRLPIGPIRECPETFALYGRAVAEIVAVGRAEGVPLDPAMDQQLMEQAHTLPPGMKASLLVDLERGRRTEVESLQGTVVRLGRQHGIPSPVTEVLYGLIKVHQPR